MSLFEVHPTLRVRLGVGFVHRFLSFMIAPLMAVDLAQRFGYATAGSLLMLAVGAAVAGMFVGGHLSDARGRRPTMLLSELGMLLGFAAMAAAGSSLWDSAVGVYLGFLLYSLSGGIGFPANDAMIIDVTTPETRAAVYTLNYWLLNLAFAFGALVGGFFYGAHFQQLLAGGALVLLATISVTWWRLAETRPEGGATVPTQRRSALRTLTDGYVAVLRDAMFARVVLAAIALGSIEWQLTYYVGVRLSESFPRQTLLAASSWRFSVDGVAMLGVLRALNTVLVVCLALQVRRVMRTRAQHLQLHLGIALFAGGFMVLAISTDAWVLVVASVVYTVGELMNVPVRQTLLADLVDPAARTRYMAVYGLHPRMAALTASLCVVVGSVVPPAAMAAGYAVLALAAAGLLRGPMRCRDARAADGRLHAPRPAQVRTTTAQPAGVS